MVIKYVVWMIMSLIVKLCSALILFNYDIVNLPLFEISNLVVTTLFAVFKMDEDCFSCFNRCETIYAYSWFQLESDKYEINEIDGDSNISESERWTESRTTSGDYHKRVKFQKDISEIDNSSGTPYIRNVSKTGTMFQTAMRGGSEPDSFNTGEFSPNSELSVNDTQYVYNQKEKEKKEKIRY